MGSRTDLCPPLFSKDYAEVAAVLQKQEVRRSMVTHEPQDVEEEVVAPSADEEQVAEKNPVPLAMPAKKASPKAKSSTPKMPPKKKTDEPAPAAAPSPAAPAKKKAPKPAAAPAEESKAKDKRTAAASAEEPSTKRVKTKSSNGKAQTFWGQSITFLNIRKLKEKEQGIPAAAKVKLVARADEIRELFSQTLTFKAWLDMVAQWVKQSEANSDKLDMAALTIEFICQQEDLKLLQFGLVEARCASVKNAKTFESRLAATQLAYKVLTEHHGALTHLQQILEQESNFVDFLHTCVASDMVLGEPFSTLLNLSHFKQNAEGEEDAYLKGLNKLMPLAYSTLLVCEELFSRKPDQAEEEEPPAEEEEEYNVF